MATITDKKYALPRTTVPAAKGQVLGFLHDYYDDEGNKNGLELIQEVAQNATGKSVVITITKSGDTFTSDKTKSEIDAAIAKGTNVLVVYANNVYQLSYILGTAYCFSWVDANKKIMATFVVATDGTFTLHVLNIGEATADKISYAPSDKTFSVNDVKSALDYIYGELIGSDGVISQCSAATNSANQAAENATVKGNNAYSIALKAIANAWMMPTCPSDQQTNGIPNSTYSSYTGSDGSTCKFFPGQMCQVETTDSDGNINYTTYRVAYAYDDKSDGKYKVGWIAVIGSTGSEKVIIKSIGCNQNVSVPIDGSVMVGVYDQTGAMIGDTQPWTGTQIEFDVDAGINYYVAATASDSILSNFSQPKSPILRAGEAASGEREISISFRAMKVTINISSDDNKISSSDAEGTTVYIDTQTVTYSGGQAVAYVAYDKYFNISGTLINKQIIQDGQIVSITYRAILSKTIISNDAFGNYNLVYTLNKGLGIGLLTVAKDLIPYDDPRIINNGKIVDNANTELAPSNILGIYVKTARINVIVKLPGESGYSKLKWYDDSVLANFIANRGKTYPSQASAQSDYYGEYNQFVLENAYLQNGQSVDVSYFPAANECKGTLWTNGMIGAYLPGYGELLSIYNNIEAFKNLLASLGFYRTVSSDGTITPTYNEIAWSSSEISDASSVSSNSLYAAKSNQLVVIPFKALSDFGI